MLEFDLRLYVIQLDARAKIDSAEKALSYRYIPMIFPGASDMSAYLTASMNYTVFQETAPDSLSHKDAFILSADRLQAKAKYHVGNGREPIRLALEKWQLSLQLSDVQYKILSALNGNLNLYKATEEVCAPIMLQVSYFLIA